MPAKWTPKRICARIGLALLAMMGVWLLSGVVITVAVTMARPNFLSHSITLWLINDVPLYGLGVPLFLLLLRAVPSDNWKSRREKAAFSPARYLLVFMVCMGCMYFFSFITNFVSSFFQTAGSDTSNMLDELAQTGSLWENILFGACVPALGEEFIFRHMLRKKMAGCGDLTYMLFSALCFAMFHGNISQVFYAFAVGIILAWCYLQTGSIWVPVSLHFFINLFGIAVLPALLENERLAMPTTVALLAIIAAAAVVVALSVSRVKATLRPAENRAWSRRAPRTGQPMGYGAAAEYTAGLAAQYAHAADAYGKAAAGCHSAGNEPGAKYYSEWGWYSRQMADYYEKMQSSYAQAASLYGDDATRPIPLAWGQPHLAQAGQVVPGQVPAQAHAVPLQKQASHAFANCIGNVGMILYLLLTGFMTLVTLLAL